MRSEGYGSCRVCVSVCPLSHISPLGLLFAVKTLSRTQRAMKVKNFVAFSLKPLRCRDGTIPPLDGHYGQFSADNTHAHCAYASSPRFAPGRKLSLCSSFMMTESSNYSCVSCYLSVCARAISPVRTVVLLYS